MSLSRVLLALRALAKLSFWLGFHSPSQLTPLWLHFQIIGKGVWEGRRRKEEAENGRWDERYWYAILNWIRCFLICQNGHFMTRSSSWSVTSTDFVRIRRNIKRIHFWTLYERMYRMKRRSGISNLNNAVIRLSLACAGERGKQTRNQWSASSPQKNTRNCEEEERTHTSWSSLITFEFT